MNFLLEKLRGHRGSVSCLTSYDDCIVSGSEDKTVRLWDLRTRKTFKCINSCFSDAIEDVQLNPKDRNYLFVASGSQLLSFDTRFDGVINREPIATYNNVGEINRLSLSPKEPLIAIGDDSNDIRIVSYSNNGELFENSAVYRAKLLRRGHTSLVNALSFRSTNPKELFSGGFDCVGNIWDTGLAKVKTSINLAVNNIEEGDGCNRMFNPPHVHAGQYLDSGKAIIVALGDGSLRLLSSRDLSMLAATQAHGGMITTLHCLDKEVLTGGTDSMINSWKIEVVSDGEDRQSSLKGSKNSSKRKLESNSYEFISLFRIEHNSKINVVHQLELIDSSGVASDVKSVMKKIESLTVDGTDSATKVDDIVCQSDITISRSSRKIAVGDVSNDISVYSSKFN